MNCLISTTNNLDTTCCSNWIYKSFLFLLVNTNTTFYLLNWRCPTAFGVHICLKYLKWYPAYYYTFAGDITHRYTNSGSFQSMKKSKHVGFELRNAESVGSAFSPVTGEIGACYLSTLKRWTTIVTGNVFLWTMRWEFFIHQSSLRNEVLSVEKQTWARTLSGSKGFIFVCGSCWCLLVKAEFSIWSFLLIEQNFNKKNLQWLARFRRRWLDQKCIVR